MEKIIKEVVLDTLSVGTTDIMEYADAHPDVRFCSTIVRNDKARSVMVSDYEPSFAELDADNDGKLHWHDCPNGWQRRHETHCGWVCRKNDRYIFIAT